MDPLTRLELWFAKWGLYAVGALILCVAVVSWLGYNSWRNSQNVEKRVESGRKVEHADTNAGVAATGKVLANEGKASDTDKKTAGIVQNFYNNPAAKTQIDHALFDDFRRGICMYRSAADLPECGTMQQVRPGEVQTGENPERANP